MLATTLFLAVILSLLDPNPHFASALLTGKQATHDLRVQLSNQSEVVYTSDAAYDSDFTPRYNIAEAPSYQIAVKPALVDDVQKIVSYALQNNLSLLATGGGHGYTTSLGRLQGGIDVDLSMFNDIQIDATVRTVTVGASVRAGKVASALQKLGLEIRSGKIVTATEEQNSDLFYAAKGAGFNFGIATSITYRTYPATNNGQAMSADMIFPGSLNGTVWELVKSFAASQPKKLTIGLHLGYTADSGIAFAANFLYAGPQDEGISLIQPFLDLNPMNLNISTVAWDEIPSVASYGAIAKYGCTPGVNYVPNAVNLYQVDVENLIRVVNYMDISLAANETLANGFSIVWQQLASHGFQLQQLDSSAFPYRDVAAFVQVDGLAASTSDIDALGTYGREVRDMLHTGSGKEDLEAYVHFANGDETPATWYSSAKVARLVELKSVYDPAGLFSWYNPVLLNK
ncbi:hypothetical protein DHEL01_v208963 [Diaporthe helianthi]|uniref:FAD-binding PCMH-type domain-containing protein n=1 Tax=Diaporthe helianthi TaxID=158607 RepID=A0A2P5HQV1_DIAHE|nr:hypothetical protein DHEL01_v208963 [Diaporthe helianthi]